MRKKLPFFFLFIVLSTQLFAADKYWIAARTGVQSWTNGTNWSDGQPPASVNDNIFFDASNVIINDFPSNTAVGKLMFRANAHVELSSGPPVVIPTLLQLLVTDTFLVSTGSTLIIGRNGVQGLTIIQSIGIGNGKALINGEFEIQGNNNSSYNCSVGFGIQPVTNVSGIIRLAGATAAVDGFLLSQPRFLSGGLLEVTRNGGQVPQSIFNAGSLIRIKGVTNTATTFAVGSTYLGSIEWNCPAQQATVQGNTAKLLTNFNEQNLDTIRILSTGAGRVRLHENPVARIKTLDVSGGVFEVSTLSGATLNVLGNVVQTGGTVLGNAFVTGEVNGNTCNINVDGNFIQTAGTFNLSDRTIATANTFLRVKGNVQIDGSLTETGNTIGNRLSFCDGACPTQQFRMGGSFLNDIETRFNNSNSVMLSSNVALPYDVYIQAGNVLLGTFQLTAASTALKQYNATNKFITNGTGALKLYGVSSATIFPIAATAATYNPATISQGQANEYAVNVAIGISPVILDPNRAINRTWTVKPTLTTGLSNVKFAFQYTGSSDKNPGCNPAGDMEVGEHDATAWQRILQAGTPILLSADTFKIDMVQTNTFQPSSASPFVVANTDAILPNSPAPVLAYFVQQQKGFATLYWNADMPNHYARFEIEQSGASNLFYPIAQKIAVGNIPYYEVKNVALGSGRNYFRLKTIAKNGDVFYSPIVNIGYSNNVDISLSITPSLVIDNALLQVDATKPMAVQLVVTDISGKQLMHQSHQLQAGSNTLLLAVNKFAAGTYYVQLTSEGRQLQAIRFVKQ